MAFQHYKETIQDIHTKFHECWGVSEKHGVFLALDFINGASESVSENSFETVGRFVSPTDFSLSTKTIELDESVYFPIPKLGFINIERYCLYLQRLHKKSSPAKYRRGFRSDTVSIKNISSREIKTLDMKKVIDTTMGAMKHETFAKIAYNVFFPKELSFQEALENVLSMKTLSSSFSSSLAIKLDSTTNTFVLMKNLWEIGDWSEKHNFFKMRTNAFNKELLDLKVPIEVKK